MLNNNFSKQDYHTDLITFITETLTKLQLFIFPLNLEYTSSVHFTFLVDNDNLDNSDILVRFIKQTLYAYKEDIEFMFYFISFIKYIIADSINDSTFTLNSLKNDVRIFESFSSDTNFSNMQNLRQKLENCLKISSVFTSNEVYSLSSNLSLSYSNNFVKILSESILNIEHNDIEIDQNKFTKYIISLVSDAQCEKSSLIILENYFTITTIFKFEYKNLPCNFKFIITDDDCLNEDTIINHFNDIILQLVIHNVTVIISSKDFKLITINMFYDYGITLICRVDNVFELADNFCISKIFTNSLIIDNDYIGVVEDIKLFDDTIYSYLCVKSLRQNRYSSILINKLNCKILDKEREKTLKDIIKLCQNYFDNKLSNKQNTLNSFSDSSEINEENIISYHHILKSLIKDNGLNCEFWLSIINQVLEKEFKIEYYAKEDAMKYSLTHSKVLNLASINVNKLKFVLNLIEQIL